MLSSFEWTPENDAAILANLAETCRAVILVAGASCSGKTTFASFLARNLDDAVVIAMDRYYRDYAELKDFPNPNNYPRFDIPEAYRVDELEDDLCSLGSGRVVRIPTYDISRNRRMGSQICGLHRRYIVEGLYAFRVRYPAYCVFVQADYEKRYERRMARDTRNLPELDTDVIARHFERVERASQDLVLPQKVGADMVIVSNTERGG